MGFLSKALSALASAAEPSASSGGGDPHEVSEFEGIVNDVAATIHEVAHVSFFGTGAVDVQFCSRSGKSTWSAFFQFDEQTGDFTCHATFASSGALHRFGEGVRDRIRSSRVP
jgi:hypothetical protein